MQEKPAAEKEELRAVPLPPAEVVLKVVTPPTFTNTSESEVRVETGRPAALFCHAEGITNNS